MSGILCPHIYNFAAYDNSDVCTIIACELLEICSAALKKRKTAGFDVLTAEHNIIHAHPVLFYYHYCLITE